ncbi:hypothetical protein EMCRGX_G006461 [Ephydatia muelleri]
MSFVAGAVPFGSTVFGNLLCEAISVINGAHLSAGSRLGNIVRQFHHFKQQTCGYTSTAATVEEHSCPLVTLSDLGVPHDVWRQALGRGWAQVNHTPALSITIQDVLHSHKGSLASSTPHTWQSRRHLSLLSSLSHNNKYRRVLDSTLVAYQRRSISISQLEDRANSETDNPKAQAKYMEAVLDIDPQYVVRRFESGRYAVDTDVRRIYMRALQLAERSNGSSTPSSSSQDQAFDVSSLGSRENPFHVVSQPKKGGFLREVWSLARFIIVAFIVTTLISSALVTQMKTGTHQMTKEFRPDIGDKRYGFDDVQGVDEAKAELQEVVAFLKEPEKFQTLGAKMPHGLLLIGPPGTGKTLLAKAIAGEADVPFFFASGSEFDEMFVGVGSARMRKLFEQARRHKPCVVFIDELDALGGARVANALHPYSRMTLNQLLVELDGYKELEGVVVIGATNFPESLDKALIRPGRFDSHIHIPLPDVRARCKILEVHAQKIKLSPDVNMEMIARTTSGFSGADLANLINQAALRGSVTGKQFVTMEDLDYAKDKIIMGPERKSAVIEEKNKKLVAYHEGGHAIVALYTPDALPIHKATIVPRGSALGMVAQMSEKDELSWSRRQLLAKLDVAMGGRVAEELVFGTEYITSGASSDLEVATKIAKHMVTKLGMSDLVGPVAVADDDKVSPATQKLIDEEIKRLLKESHDRAQQLLKNHSTEHKRLAEALLKYETLDIEEIKTVVAGKLLPRNV